jgi:hypothetical protein
MADSTKAISEKAVGGQKKPRLDRRRWGLSQ